MRILTALTALGLLVTLTTASSPSSNTNEDGSCKDVKCMAERLQSDPSSLENWLNVASHMSIGESVKVGEAEYEKPAHVVADAIRSIDGQTQNASMWTTMAFYHRDILFNRHNRTSSEQDRDPSLEIEGQSYTRLAMIKKALDVDPNFARAWVVLSSHIRSLESQDAQDADSANPEDITRAQKAASADKSRTVEVNGKEYTARAAIDEALRVDPTSSGAWVELGRFLSGESKETATINGKEYTRRDCYEAAVQHGPQDFLAWTLLGLELLTAPVHYPADQVDRYRIYKNPNEDGKVYNAQDALIKAIEIEPKFALSWARLGDSISVEYQAEGVEYPLSLKDITIHGKTFSKQALYEQALRRDQYLATAWISLAGTLRSDNPRDQPKSNPILGKRHSSVDCLIRGLSVNPRLAIAWVLLGQRMPLSEKVTINEQEFTRSDCFKNAVELDPRLPAAWAGLGTSTPPGKTVEITDSQTGEKKSYDARAAFIKSIQLKKDFAVMFMSLSATMKSDERVEIPGLESPTTGTDASEDGSPSWTPIQLLVKAVQLSNPNFGENLGFLAQRMLERKMKEISFASPFSQGKEKTWTPVSLLVEALKSRPMIGNFWFALGGQLKNPADKVTVNNREYGMFDCLVQTVTNSPRNSIAWVNIGLMMKKEEMKSVTIREQNFTPLDVFVRALEIDPDQDRVWGLMTEAMPEDNTEVTVRGRVFRKKDILAEFERQKQKAAAKGEDNDKDEDEEVIPSE